MLYRIRPFKDEGLWVFTDIGIGLDKEPLVAGIDTMLDIITKDIEDAPNGFELRFSDKEFDGWAYSLEWQVPGDMGGDWYSCPQLGIEGWLCPALGKYFGAPPPVLYLAALYLKKPYIYSYPLSMREPDQGLIRPKPMTRAEAERKYHYLIRDPEMLRQFLERFPVSNDNQERQ